MASPHDIETLEAALLGYEQQKKNIDAKIADIRLILQGASPPVVRTGVTKGKGGRRKRAPLSSEALARISAAQKKRWAAFKKAKKTQ